jgi:hypothetical protein
VAGVIVVDYTAGYYQQLNINSGTVVISVSNWPSSGIYANIKLALVCANTGTVLFNTSQSSPPGNNVHSTQLPYLNTVTTTSTTIWELFTANAGTDVYARLIMGPTT